MSCVTATALAASCDSGSAKFCCTVLEQAGLRVLRPGSEAYAERDASYFSLSAQQAPYCIVQPAKATEVATAITTLTEKTTCNWAVRAGGHMTWANASNIHDGVTIELGLMADIKYSPSTTHVSIGAGALWRDVYAALEPYGVTAPGGRTSTVGVAGFVLGGGNNFFSSNVGLGCDNVVNFEVVLADGRIINANRDEHADLHKVLKGGSSNFGIVTRIDMQTVPTGGLWGGQIVYPLSTTNAHIDAYVHWVANISSYPAGSAVTFWAYTPASGIIVSAALHDTSGAEWSSPAYDDFRTIGPQVQDTLRRDSHLNFTVELEEPTGYRQIWITLTSRNDARFIRAAVDAQAEFIAAWKDAHDATQPDFLNYITFQAMPRLLFQHSVEKGGNIIGMDRETEEKGDAILFQMQHMVRSAEEEVEARAQLLAMRRTLKEQSASLRLDMEWEYLGYADGGQDPLSTYGAENIALMKRVAADYDPQGIFQTRMPGGFKISKVV
ncbi:6-hydroxy-D-nicotine oxidase [Microdochium trichocladiopsis]|uniref:6-hydroxy-D-nicotine oxidase n=1 Tax=Microdochium trichocladiopsis TaxID=1682393 RepID=A0A9P8XSG8_9PEZI|nr:6-hydroxy-D-nicotine oxidase [Microdochium trichocladiopsis]KAH7014426.1 6-hydroxy-D-nicotine oxidase [Microdochium trichocladiopsis]